MTLAPSQLALVTGGGKIDRDAAEAQADKWGKRIGFDGALGMAVLGSRVRGARFIAGTLAAFSGAVFGYIGGHAYGWDKAVTEQQSKQR